MRAPLPALTAPPPAGPRERPLRVLVVTDQFEPMVGGVPTVTSNLAQGLAARGHQVAVVAPSPDRRSASARAGDVSVTCCGSLPWPWYDGMRLGWLSVASARTVIASFSPDVAHIHSPATLGVMARAAATRRGVPVVYTNHFLPANVHPSSSGRSRLLDAVFYRHVVGFSNRCSHVTAPTATALGLLRERGLRAPSRVVSNGTDLGVYAPGPVDSRIRQRYGLPADRPLVLSVGRLSPEKRIDVLLDAAVRLGPVAQVVVAGTGPDETRLRARARRLGLAETVRFLGFVPAADLPALYRSADVFAITSEAELQSLATMEAMASGLPVVAVDACALGELVRHGDNGFLARPGDDAGVAAHLAVLCRDASVRARMSAAGLRIIQDHDRNRVLAAWEALYRTLLPAGPTGRVAR